jgi:hypothetical protein
MPRESDQRVSSELKAITHQFIEIVELMGDALSGETRQGSAELAVADCQVGDSTKLTLKQASIDLVLGSPPYCTRIDYTISTRVELAVIAGWVKVDLHSLGQQMIGSTRVPIVTPPLEEAWGQTCISFLEQVKSHPSKASSGYYYKTHLDYFDKIYRSLGVISSALRPSAKAVLVVQDSYYKDVRNPLPEVFIEMAHTQQLALTQKHDFMAPRSMNSVNSASRRYRANHCPIESVLYFEKLNPEAADYGKRVKFN